MELKNNYYDINNKSIPEIRFLPMSKDVFKTYEDVVEFLSKTMCEKGGEYEYIRCKMRCKEGSLVLFQYDAQLIGSAKLSKIIDYEKPIIDSEGNKCCGHYIFDISSIRIFDSSITAKEYKKIDKLFKEFGQGSRETELKHLSKVLTLVNSKISDKDENFQFTIEEISNPEDIPEGAKKQIVVNAYERNREAREKCIEHYKRINNGKIKCEICEFEFSERYGEKFKEKIHIHHITELSEIGDEYIVDPINDLLPVCPNCHMILHSKRPAHTPDEVKKYIEIAKRSFIE
ncbi:HNH endonuclease [Clostridium beijerinckii]|uniref:HNH endonuclease n=1 Tax=Clostridium beijerinckii TaxID=1520 RepID=UPI000A818E3E|nr:HNH endonuclease [Clostridium beijerinckii]